MTPTEKITQEGEKRNWAEMAAMALIVERVYHNTINRIFGRSGLLKKNPDGTLDLNKNPLFQKIITDELDLMVKNLENVTVKSVRKSWELSNNKNDELVRSFLAGRKLPEKVTKKLLQTNITALGSFIERKRGGLSLSGRIWNLGPQFRQEIEAGLQLGIAEGKSAARMATEMKQYLNDPDKLFRRVRDEFGELKLSKAAKDYEPGQGKYRSSYRNALRLTRNEMNMAYRTADYERWQDMDFILGFEVKLSAMHPVYDICDEAAGFYPKNFKFTGWHTNCLCYATPVTPNQKEFSGYIDSILEGKSHQFTGKITRVPEGFTNWIATHQEAILRMKSKPFFILDNFIDGDIRKGLKVI